jgi:hypothetical protein
MGTISSGVDEINNIFRQGRQDEVNAKYREAEGARLDEQTRAAKTKQDELDRTEALRKQADDSGAKVLNGYRAQSILDGGDQNGYKPSIAHMSEAYAARGNAYLNAGDMTGYLKSHAEGAAARASVRADRVKEAMSSGDPTSVLKAMNETVDNGINLQEIKPVEMPTQSPGGAPGQVYQATYKLPDGSTRSETLTADDINKRAGYVLSNPDKVGEQELKYDYLRQQTQSKLKEQNNQLSNQKELERIQSGYTKEEIAARGADARRTKGMVSGDAKLKHDDEDGEPSLKDALGSVREDRLSVAGRRSSLQKDLKEQMDGLRPSDKQGRAALQSAYERQVAALDEEDNALKAKREQLSQRVGLSSKTAAPKATPKAGLSTKAPGTTSTTVTNW